MIVFLTGFMGSGKSTLGVKLARLAGVDFIDLDREIEKREGMSTGEIFRLKGESYFREAESEVLRSVVSSAGAAVIATGGGTPCFRDNIEYMNGAGVTVYLRMTPGALASRLGQGDSSRPLIEGLKGEALYNYIVAKLAEREPYYKRSAIIFEGLDSDPGELLEIIRSGS